ncbi:16S rRNA (uracil(1498)-N(3))-methyltransferase [Psychrobacter arenosus]|uniref:16S rRNA (uracil(1498)-N(3))-methyltransferase n=1 Tax=Psychrobacter arenosus TaxID=256326 RepID=UPI00191939E5|nr:16S rRNA (uracil(1498)-N(3))-methyltransferase [Psychrobacter arenosus]
MNCLLLPAAAFSPLLEDGAALPPREQDGLAAQFDSAVISDPQQIAHIKTVLGAKVGDTLKIGQKAGNLGTGIIQSIAAREIVLEKVVLNEPPPAKLALTVILALPRPKVLRRLIMDMTALGVQHIILLNSYRTQKSYWQSPMLARLEDFMQEGLQQACDTVAPRITLNKRFKPFVEDELPGLLAGEIGVVAHPYAAISFSEFIARQQAESLSKPTSKPNSAALPKLLCIGAEGGWIDYEIDLLQRQGCQPVTIGARILRTEAAVNALIGQWLIH